MLMAQATIQAMKGVTDEVLRNVEVRRQAELDDLNQKLELNLMTQEAYNAEVAQVNTKYDEIISKTESANNEIRNTITEAAQDGRALTEEELFKIVLAYQSMSSNAGTSLGNVAAEQELLGISMQALVESTGLNSLQQSGIISTETAKQIASLGKNEDKVNALKKALEEYNNKTVPSKDIKVEDKTSTGVNSAQQNINSVKGKTVDVFIDVYRRAYGNTHMYARGGHIGGMFAKGGNISTWAGAFASGASSVPQGYTGIVGEAGPEIFQVSKRGVTITPLSTREKMRGIEGILDQAGGKGNVTVTVNISNPQVREDQDIQTLTSQVADALKREFNRMQLMGV